MPISRSWAWLESITFHPRAGSRATFPLSWGVGVEKGGMTFKLHQGSANKKRERGKKNGCRVDNQQCLPQAGPSVMHLCAFPPPPLPSCAGTYGCSTNSGGIEPNEELSCGCEKTVSVIIVWHNWTFVHRNWKESHEIQTDAKKRI